MTRVGLYREHGQPRLLDASMASDDLLAVRERVCAGLAGDVVEIGYGSGRNTPHLPPAVTGVWAVEPSAVAWGLSARRRAGAGVPVVLGASDAQHLPFPDGRFDAALCTWTLCGIADRDAALAEVRRVLAPGGELHLVEHGLAPDAGVARWQRRLGEVSRRVAGCSLDHDVRASLERSGLEVTELRAAYLPRAPRVAGHLVEGRARAGAAA